MKDHYQILGVANNATNAEIKASYRRLVKRYHPDINPDPAAIGQMIAINEAYEILSDPTSRSLYDMYLSGIPVMTVIEEITPEQRYRVEYIRKRNQRIRERIQYQIHYKQLFYTYFRYFNIVCFVASLLFTYDYYFDSAIHSLSVKEVIDAKYGTYVGFENGYRIRTSDDFFNAYQRMHPKLVRVHLSGLLQFPKNISIQGEEGYYRIYGGLFSFNNVFSVLLFIFSIVVVANKNYTDFRLTCGLVACIILIWLVALISQ